MLGAAVLSARSARAGHGQKVVRQTLKGDEEDERPRARLVGNLIASFLYNCDVRSAADMREGSSGRARVLTCRPSR
jgi:hypothetical protein